MSRTMVPLAGLPRFQCRENPMFVRVRRECTTWIDGSWSPVAGVDILLHVNRIQAFTHTYILCLLVQQIFFKTQTAISSSLLSLVIIPGWFRGGEKQQTIFFISWWYPYLDLHRIHGFAMVCLKKSAPLNPLVHHYFHWHIEVSISVLIDPAITCIPSNDPITIGPSH